MIETTHDLIILLSGIASNRTLLTDYTRRVHSLSTAFKDQSLPKS